MKPEGMDYTIMRCCKRLVMGEPQQSGSDLWVSWRCPTCGRLAQQHIGKIDARQADHLDQQEEHVCDDDCRSNGCHGRRAETLDDELVRVGAYRGGHSAGIPF